MTQRVFVLDNRKQPLMPCHPARARELLAKGKGAVFRRAPFTIILKHWTGGDTQPMELKADPGSKTTGLALVALFERGRQVLWAGNLSHRGKAIKIALDGRRALRRGRRNRKIRYRAPRFDNRDRPSGWLPPSLMSRVDNVAQWAKRLIHLAPVSELAVETIRFDTQLMENPGIEGTEYQQGTLMDWELREYLFYRHDHTCAYCNGLSKETVLEREHVHPRAKGGSNRLSNQVIACRICNTDKGNQQPKAWLEKLKASRKRIDRFRASRLDAIIKGQRPLLQDAAAMNAVRYRIGDVLHALGLPITFWSGGRTKKNRSDQDYQKDHWIDAACVGESGEKVIIPANLKPLQISAKGRGSRQMCRMDRFGFPRTRPKTVKRIHGLQTGDLVRLCQPGGKYKGTHKGRVAVRARGSFDIQTLIEGVKAKFTAPHRRFTLLQRDDGYHYV